MHTIPVSENVLRVPSYVKKFECLCCGACCLQKWEIGVDQSTYKKLQEKFKDLEREEEFSALIKRDDKGKIFMRFKQGRCIMLDDKNLCKIQKEFGHEFLPDVCKIYPRRIFATSRGVDFAFIFSCKAAANRLKEKQRAIIEKLSVQTPEFSFMKPNETIVLTPEKLAVGYLKKYYYIIEDGFIKIMQDRQYSISERLAMIQRIVLSFKQLFTQEESGYPMETQVTNILAGYVAIGPVIHNPQLHLTVLKQIFMFSAQEFPEMRTALTNIYKGVASAGKVADAAGVGKFLRTEPFAWEISVEDYSNIVNDYIRPVWTNLEQILENFFVNYIFKKYFYVGDLQTVFFGMAFLRATLQFFLAGYGILLKKPVTEELVIDVVMVVEEMFSHNEVFWKKIIEQYEKNPDEAQVMIALALAKTE